MNDSQYAIDEIIIVNKEKPIKIGNLGSGIILNNGQIGSNTSGVMGDDFSRQIQLLPGISAHDDNSAEIKIRGSNSEETLMILDGMPIYSANHYYGIFSGVNTSYIDSLNLFKNTYPIHYGGRTAGLVELFSDNRIPTKSTISTNIDLLTGSAIAKIPMSKNSSFSVAARSTLKDVDNQQFNTVNSKRQENQQVQDFKNKSKNQNSDPSFRFYDMNAKYQWATEKSSLRFNLFRSADKVKNEYSTEITDNQGNKLKLFAIENQEWSSIASSILFDTRINDDLIICSRAFFSKYKNDEQIDVKLDKDYKNHLPSGLFDKLKSKQDNSLTDIGIDSYLKYKKGSHSIKVGVMATQHDISYGFRENNELRFGGSATFLEIGGYTSYDIEISKKLNLSAGLRAIYYSNLLETMLSPRLSANYKVSDRLTFKSSYGLEQQVIRQFDYEYRAQPMQLWLSAGENNVPVLASSNFMLGTTYKHHLFSIDIELYQKYKSGVVEYSVLTPSNPNEAGAIGREYELFIGDGISKGIDIILGSGYGSYDTYLSYTLSSNEQQFEKIFNNKFYPSENDRRHQLKWINSLSTGPMTWGFNAIFVSGLPYIDITRIDVGRSIKNIDPNSLRERLRPYHRIDISTAYDFKIGSKESSLSFSVFNLLNTNNVKYLQSVATSLSPNQTPINTIVGNETNLLNRTVNLGLKVKL